MGMVDSVIEEASDFVKINSDNPHQILTLLDKDIEVKEFIDKDEKKYKRHIVYVSVDGEEKEFRCSASTAKLLKQCFVQGGRKIRISRTPDDFKPYKVTKVSEPEPNFKNADIPNFGDDDLPF